MKGCHLASKNIKSLSLGLILLLAVRIIAMFVVPLTDPTEARYAEIARKMAETGNWITPQFDYGVPFWAKPPLHTWLSALGIEAFGANEFAARLGILFATIALLVILWRWLEQLTDRTTALVTLLILCSAALFFVAIAFVQTDMVLTLGIVACMTGFYSAMRGDRRWAWMFFAGIAIGMLAKGPVSVVLSMTPIALWVIWRREWSNLGRLPWVSGLAVAAIISIPWYVAAEIATPGFLKYFIIGEHIQRFLDPGWTGDLYGSGREHAKGTIWLYWIVAALPWSPMLPILGWRLYKRGIPADGDGLQSYLLLFAIVPLVFFTAAANILVTYTLPALPAAAALGVILWRRSGTGGGTWLKVGVAEIMVLVIGLIVACLIGKDSFLPSRQDILAHFPQSHPLTITGGRDFSAEFYRHGQITTIQDVDQLPDTLSPGAGYLVRNNQVDAFEKRYGDHITELAKDKSFRLFEAH
ncbi:glycosyltransferase family 39 protein [Martelella alba]|uniref:Glycosyltransferase family 39 protein n=1 Tax=Martelella alba TaxID=2590451 RepID=A0A506UCD9_9HYPH|nr:glycosyltransferase family 39 protein [Martelella alba]